MPLQKIKQYVAQDKLDKALKKLSELLTNSDYSNDIIGLQARLNSLKQQERSAIISYDNATISRNKIRASLLSLIDQIADDDDLNLSKDTSTNTNNGNSTNIQNSSVVGNNTTIISNGSIIIGNNNNINS